MSAVNDYYYRSLSKEQQKLYFAIYEGVSGLAKSFQIPFRDSRELSEIYFLVRMDHPEIFYTVSFKYRHYPDSDKAELIPEYLFPVQKIKEHQQAMDSRMKKLIREAEKLDEKGKELFIHDFICKNVKYDKLKKPYSHEIMGVLGLGIGVCEGIAKTVKILCDRLGIWCIVVLSEANPEKKIKYRHAWNIVKIGGVYFHLDVTFDNSLSKDLIRYDYYNINDVAIYRDHEPSIYRVVECRDGSKNYYREKKLSFSDKEQVRKRIAQAVKKKKSFLFQWTGTFLTREILSELLTIAKEEAEKRNVRPKLSLNWPQAVMEFSFSEELPQEMIVLEEANEGEKYGEET